jgi:xylan 1,4-beta-xylosidase
MTWLRDFEGRRVADLGDGRFLNPILPGDHPDPTILKDGGDYYATFSSFDATPGLPLWHSRDLVNWTPIGSALLSPPGTVFASDLVKHDGRYYIYIPFIPALWSRDLPPAPSIHVIHADDIRGPWSAPVELGIEGYIDPGHVVGEDGRRYLFLSGVSRVRLTDDGLATDGPIEHVYDGWAYPEHWVTEAYALEGPKLFRRGDWFYLVSAVGGTAGPPTGHMVVAARSRSIHGPWENCPHNPIVRTWSADERWWSRGHATVFEGPDERWWMIYHGYENGFRSLGRQVLLEPLTWDSGGWFHAEGGDLSQPLPMPAPGAATTGLPAWSDDFNEAAFGTRWTFFGAAPDESRRAVFGDGLLLAAKGTGPSNSSPLVGNSCDLSYECSVHLELEGDAQGGLLLFFNNRLFLGMGIDGERMTTWRGGASTYWQEPAPAAPSLHLRIVNDRQIVTMFYSLDGQKWARHGVRSEVSGYNANTIDDLQALRPALYAAGSGRVRFREYRYRGL